jgi:hypothetical protein
VKIKPPRYSPDGKSVVIVKNRTVGSTAGVIQGMLPVYEYEIEEGGKKYFLAEYIDGDIFWYLNGELHRELGPAAEFGDGGNNWYFHGERIYCQSQEVFSKYINLKAFW